MLAKPRFFAANHSGSFSGCGRQHVFHSDNQWTAENPRFYTCMTCFNSRRACFLGLGDKKWIVLPLPPAMRQADPEWRQEGYYIYQGSGTVASFPGISLSKSGGGKKRKRVQVVEEDDDDDEEVVAVKAKREP